MLLRRSNCTSLHVKTMGICPMNAKDSKENDIDLEMSGSEEPCYSATPNNDLARTKFKNIKIANRKDEEIIILNKGKNSEGFDVCKKCGAAQIHSKDTLENNGYNRLYTSKKENYNCKHSDTAIGIYLGTSFLTDMYFMQIQLKRGVVTEDRIVLDSLSKTLKEALKLSIVRILDIEYNDLKVGYRIREDDLGLIVDIYFYDSLSSGAGYSSQVEDKLDKVFDNTLEILSVDDSRELCNFWNQKDQYAFNNDLGSQLLKWGMEGILPRNYDSSETEKFVGPINAIFEHETNLNLEIIDNNINVKERTFEIVPAFIKTKKSQISDFDITYSLPNAFSKITNQ